MSSDDDGRLRAAAKRFLIVEAGVLGVVSAVATLVPVIPWPYWSAIGLIGTAGSLLWAARAQKPQQLIVPNFSKENDSLEVPMTHDILEAAVHEAHQVYGHDALPLSVVEGWWARNNWAFASLKSESGKYLGYFDLLPITGKWAKQFELGEIEEREMPPESILPATEMKNAQTLYLSSIAVMEHGTEEGKRRTAKIIWGLTKYVDRYYGTQPRRVLAIAATPSGERLLESFGARVIQNRAARKDGHDLYEVRVTPDLILAARERAMHRTYPPKMSFKDIGPPLKN